ncbi:hypothetical protein OG767_00245 [Micromonospora sp. NBC_01392]|uniref:hypothetical protein n=1 Tax=Micromonospora sp. NBC_01392 TaxID=2903588 RepID=UPI0032463FA8
MAGRLPLLSTQLGFLLMAERTGRRVATNRLFRLPPVVLSAGDLNLVLRSIVLRNPTLSYRLGISRGEAYQERRSDAYDFAEVRAEDEAAVARLRLAVVDEFENDLDGAALAARLVRTREADYLLMVFDHALVDGESQATMVQQLATPAPAADGLEERFEAAVRERAEFEKAATVDGRRIAFWTERLKKFPEELPPGTAPMTPELVSVVRFPGVARPSAFRGSYFPYALFSIHRALRDVTGAATTAIAYAWGHRSTAFIDVTGCFLNTVISLDRTGPRGTMAGFLDDWYLEIDHADMPFVSVAGLGSAFSGSVSGMLAFTAATEGNVNVAGIEAIEIPLPKGRNQPIQAFTAAATVRKHEIGLELMVNKEAGYAAHDLGARWHRRLSEALSSFSPERRS